MIILAFPTVSTIYSTYYTLSFLNVIAFLLFSHAAFEMKPPLEGPHSCRLDDCRVPLRSSLPHICLVYVLPSKKVIQTRKRASPCIRAKFSCKVLDEHVEIDKRVQELEPHFAKWSLETCRDAISAVVYHRVGKISVTGQEDQLRALDGWMELRNEDSSQGMNEAGTPSDFDAQAASKVIRQFGREVAMALLVWDTLLFEWRHKLYQSPGHHFRRQLVNSIYTTAVQKNSPIGMPMPPSGDTKHGVDRIQGENSIRFKDQASLSGYRGFVSAVTYACQVLCQEPSDASRMTIQGALEKIIQDLRHHVPYPEKSRALPNDKETFLSWEDYCGRVWSRCWELDHSTFGALYLCMSAWHADVGDTAELGETQRLFPIRSLEVGDDAAEYASGWRMRWRHLWHVAVVCQLVVMLPTIINKFFAVATFVI